MLQHIERGNTAAGVNAAILEYLTEHCGPGSHLRFLDVPCGNGAFLRSAKRLFPFSECVGADISALAEDIEGIDRFVTLDAARERLPADLGTFDVITSISGIMEFGNTQFFLSGLAPLLKTEGLLIISNDNLLSIRDRWLYLLFGRTGQYRGIPAKSQPTWNPITAAALLRQIADAGYSAIDFCFVRPRRKEFLWAPLALLNYCVQRAYDKLTGFDRTSDFGFPIHGPISFFSRHYFIVCRKAQSAEK